jgi:GcrA cell cycle regulator
MDWTADAIRLLRLYWAEGLSIRRIGQRLGCSRNAVVGKAHRLNLPARASPIRPPSIPAAVLEQAR